MPVRAGYTYRATFQVRITYRTSQNKLTGALETAPNRYPNAPKSAIFIVPDTTRIGPPRILTQNKGPDLPGPYDHDRLVDQVGCGRFGRGFSGGFF